jgi:hypothetical protein
MVEDVVVHGAMEALDKYKRKSDNIQLCGTIHLIILVSRTKNK